MGVGVCRSRSDVSEAAIDAAYYCPWLITGQITTDCVSCRCAISGPPPPPRGTHESPGPLQEKEKSRGPSFDLSFLRAFAAALPSHPLARVTYYMYYV
ncbi:hypothetical protein LZ30DRAFT_460147 [Colletotrichum cereale]|nr:hypothetical protein LZ30DRAFT_460147 [Colletotrichum cereale]